MGPFKIEINGECLTVENVRDFGWSMIELEDGTDWYIFQDSEDAGEEARKYWEDLARDDPKEFTCIVGEENLINWGLGISSGPGSTAVKSLEDWLDLWLDTPEEQWASYDGCEVDCRISKNLQRELLLENRCVCYRHN